MWVRNKIVLHGIILPLLFCTLATGQEVPVVAPQPTLWSFLGVPQGAKKVQGALFNRRGNKPKLEPKDAVKAINDPLNLLSPNEAIKQAAKVKMEEDLKPQKIKAIKYLSSIGCGCYDKDGEITIALMAASEDCTEDVRVTTMEELYKASTGKCCSRCGMTCCCKEPLLKKLAQIAYEKDEFGCYLEPSKRVREGAIKVLQACCPSPIPPILEPEKKAPVPPVRPEIQGEGEQPAEEVQGERAEKDAVEAQGDDEVEEEPTKTPVTSIRYRLNDQPVRTPKPVPTLRLSASQPQAIVNPDIFQKSVPNPLGGVVIGYNPDQQLAYVHFEDPEQVAELGTVVYVRVNPARGTGYRGSWKVVASAKGRANLVPHTQDEDNLILPGDHVMFGVPPVSVVSVGFSDF